MSLLPMLLDYYDPWMPRRSRQNDWDLFALGITPRQIHDLMTGPRRTGRLREPSPDSTPTTIGKDGFQACIDVNQFQPNEISVKTIENTIVIEGKHEERQDEHGYISRHFVRKYTLPKGYDPKEVVSTMSSDGILTVTAPPPKKELQSNERMVQIQQTGPARLNVKENKPEGGDGDKKAMKDENN